MKRCSTHVAIFLAACATALAQDTGADRVVVRARDSLRPRLVDVNTTNGGITVKSYDGKDVIIEAQSPLGPFRRGPSTVDGLKHLDSPGGSTLEVKEQGNTITVRTNPAGNTGVTITVPSGTSLQLKTDNGLIQVDSVRGEIDASDVNGAITLNNVSGTVVAHSLNGAVVVVMNRVDSSKPISFSTLNGTIDVTLPADLKANLKLKTDRGDIYSDFDIKLDANSQPLTEKNKTSDGRFRVREERTVTGTINGGGVEASFNTFNGRIMIRRKK